MKKSTVFQRIFNGKLFVNNEVVSGESLGNLKRLNTPKNVIIGGKKYSRYV